MTSIIAPLLSSALLGASSLASLLAIALKSLQSRDKSGKRNVNVKISDQTGHSVTLSLNTSISEEELLRRIERSLGGAAPPKGEAGN
jgi:hypothetical protein